MNTENEEAKKSIVLQTLWKHKTNVDIKTNVEWMEKHRTTYKIIFVSYMLIPNLTLMMGFYILLMNIPLYTLNWAKWLFLLGITVSFFLYRWFSKTGKKYEQLRTECDDFYRAVDLLLSALSPRKLPRLDSERVLRDHFSIVFVNTAKVMLIHEGRAFRDEELIEKTRTKFSAIFNAAKAFGLTRADWSPYFAEARKDLNIPTVNK